MCGKAEDLKNHLTPASLEFTEDTERDNEREDCEECVPWGAKRTSTVVAGQTG